MTAAAIGKERLRVALGVAAIIVLGLAYQMASRVNHDPAYYVYAAKKLLGGGSYPTQIYDINPPLIVLLSVPPALLADFLPPPVAFDLYVYALFGLSLWMTLALVPLRFDDAPRLEGVAVMAWAALALFIPGFDFGQREHIMVIVAAPYLCLVARRWSGIPSSRGVAIACASFCAVGLLLKPTFLALPLAVFVIDVVRERSLRRTISADNLAFAAWTLAYAALLWGFFPGYFQIAADGVHTYGRYEMSAMEVSRETTHVLVRGGFCLVVASLLGARGMLMHLLWLCGLVVAVTALSVMLQMKGWPYHLLPAWTATAFTATFVAIFAIQRMIEDRRRWPIFVVLLACLAGSGFVPVARSLGYFFRENSLQTLAGQPLYARLHLDMRGSNVMALTSAAGPEVVAFHSGAGWGSRFIAYLDLPFVEDKLANSAGLPAGEAERVQRLDRMIKTATTEDIRLYRPKFIFVETTPKMQAMRPGYTPLLDYFRQDADVARELANYDVYSGSPQGVLDYYGRSFVVLQRRAG